MTEAVTRYPLTWPRGWKRTIPYARQAGTFGKARTIATQNGSYTSKQPLTVSQATDRLTTELARLGAMNVTISTNLKLRQDGFPRSDQRAPDDPGAAVYFTLNKKERCLACDRYTKVESNLAALAAHIEALRAIERHGVGTIDQAFAGYTALPPASVDWRLVFGYGPSTPVTMDDLEGRYRTLARAAHPDIGGDPDAMSKLNVARDLAREELR